MVTVVEDILGSYDESFAPSLVIRYLMCVSQELVPPCPSGLVSSYNSTLKPANTTSIRSIPSRLFQSSVRGVEQEFLSCL